MESRKFTTHTSNRNLDVLSIVCYIVCNVIIWSYLKATTFVYRMIKKGVHEKESQIASLEIKIYEWFLYEYKHGVCKAWKNVKYTLVQALRLCSGRTAHRGSRGIAVLFHDHGTRRGWGVSVTPRPLFTPRKDAVPIVQEAGWAPGTVWTGAENLATTGIRFPDCPARSQSL